jgi:lysophospholipase L1-like esterase
MQLRPCSRLQPPCRRAGELSEARLRELLFVLTVPVLASLLTLLAVEVLLRLFRPVPHSIEVNMYFAPDPHTGYRPEPNSVGWFGPLEAAVNRHGHRDDAVALKKPPGTFRILVLGDSFTVGASVRQEEAYPQRLETLLNQSATGRIEVVNAGVGGWDSFQYAQYYEHAGHRFSPDLVIIGFFVSNDAYTSNLAVSDLPTAVMGRRVERVAAQDPLVRVKIFAYERLHLARFFFNRAQGHVLHDSAARERDGCQDFSRAYLLIQSTRLPNHGVEDGTRRALAGKNIAQIVRVRDLAADAGIPVIVVLIPDESQINAALQRTIVRPDAWDRYDFDMPQAMIVPMFADHGIPIIDLLPLFRADPRCLYRNDTHWTPAGHELAALAIRERIDGMTRAR